MVSFLSLQLQSLMNAAVFCAFDCANANCLHEKAWISFSALLSTHAELLDYVRLNTVATSEVVLSNLALADPSWHASQFDLLLIVVAGALAVAGAVCALIERAYSHRLRKRMVSFRHARNRGVSFLRDRFIADTGAAVTVWEPGKSEPLSFGGGREFLEHCRSGADKTAFSSALSGLLQNGMAFTLCAHTTDGGSIGVVGRPVDGYAVVFFRPEYHELECRLVLDMLPVPVWIRGKTLNLEWVNRCFLATSGVSTCDKAVEANTAFHPSERDLASAAHEAGALVEGKRYATIGGSRRAFCLALQPLADGRVIGAAQDITGLTEAKAQFRRNTDDHSDVLNIVPTALAVFGSDRRLASYNRAYAALWDVSDVWLSTHPSYVDILDRLRELRRLPDQQDFAAWKRDRIKLFETADVPSEELWHLPNGKTLRVKTKPYRFGGQIVLFEDVTTKMGLKSSYNAAINVQRAILDTLEEGAAIFGPDGRLKRHNAAFARQWRLSDEELSDEPHLKRIAEACSTRFGNGRIWEIVSAGISSAAPEQYNDAERFERPDHSVLSLTLKRLPDATTLARFADITDQVRFELELRASGGGPQAVVAV
jgi:PAS domain-containing protein